MEQNYKNHARLVKGYHGILALLILTGFIGSLFNLCGSWNNESLYSASLITLLFVCCILLFWFTRSFPLKAQDRAIRSEENFRHFILTGKPLPSELKIGQIIRISIIKILNPRCAKRPIKLDTSEPPKLK
jgi:hypothetical protein